MQNYYPERLGCCLLLNAPGVFKLLWSAIKRVLSPRTAEKIVFLGGDYKEKLLLYFHAEQIPQVTNSSSSSSSKRKSISKPHDTKQDLRCFKKSPQQQLPPFVTMNAQCMGGTDAFDCAAWCTAELGPPAGPIWPEKKGWFSGALCAAIAASFCD
jgi:hypothetical protein